MNGANVLPAGGLPANVGGENRSGNLFKEDSNDKKESESRKHCGAFIVPPVFYRMF
jgi:hypothetical protein